MIVTGFIPGTDVHHAGIECQECHAPAKINVIGYCEHPGSIFLCAGCALQLVRKLTEDLCELLTKGGRHG